MRRQIAAGRTLPSHGWGSDRLETDWRARTPLLASLAAEENLAVRVAAAKPVAFGLAVSEPMPGWVRSRRVQ